MNDGERTFAVEVVLAVEVAVTSVDGAEAAGATLEVLGSAEGRDRG